MCLFVWKAKNIPTLPTKKNGLHHISNLEKNTTATWHTSSVAGNNYNEKKQNGILRHKIFKKGTITTDDL